MDAVVIQDRTKLMVRQGFNAFASAQCCIYARGGFEEKFKLG